MNKSKSKNVTKALFMLIFISLALTMIVTTICFVGINNYMSAVNDVKIEIVQSTNKELKKYENDENYILVNMNAQKDINTLTNIGEINKSNVEGLEIIYELYTKNEYDNYVYVLEKVGNDNYIIKEIYDKLKVDKDGYYVMSSNDDENIVINPAYKYENNKLTEFQQKEYQDKLVENGIDAAVAQNIFIYSLISIFIIITASALISVAITTRFTDSE